MRREVRRNLYSVLRYAYALNACPVGEMTEWLKVHAWKACVLLTGYRGFESLSLRRAQEPDRQRGPALL